MARKNTELRVILERFQLYSAGNLAITNVNREFRRILDKFDYPSIKVNSIIDPNQGIFVKFRDTEGDSVIILFSYDAEGDPVAQVVSDDDDQITINLSPLEPMSTPDEEYIDLTDLSWINKSVLTALLNAGDVNENCRVIVGKRQLRLPVVMRREKQDSDVRPEELDWVEALEM